MKHNIGNDATMQVDSVTSNRFAQQLQVQKLEAGTCMRILGPFKYWYLVCASAHSHFFLLKLQLSMGICLRQYSACIIILSAYLILPVMALSLAVLFHRDIMSSVGLTEITAPHISLPTINCSPSIASSCDSRKIASQLENTTTYPLNECSEPILRTPFHLDTILYPSCPRGTLDDT